ncbi:hypothetical protein EOL01_28330 [Citrobacter freundii]|nr:hypothetical protein EOL01_28330 [Citrobacter freundii]
MTLPLFQRQLYRRRQQRASYRRCQKQLINIKLTYEIQLLYQFWSPNAEFFGISQNVIDVVKPGGTMSEK